MAAIALGSAVFIRWTEANADEKKDQSFQNTDRRQTTVISCRDIVDNSGYQNPKKKTGFWEIVGPVSRTSVLFGSEDSGSVGIVFVHGYNTSLSDAVQDGEKLWLYLRSAANEEAQKRIPAASRLERASFFTFCWHGDFGALGYPISVGVAEASVPSLVAFLKELHSQALRRQQSPSLIVITHSLGASVALGAFDCLLDKETNGWVDCTLLVQPAIDLKTILREHFDAGYGKVGPSLLRFSKELESRQASIPQYPYRSLL